MYSPVLNFSQKAVDPPFGVVPEFEFYLNLARKMGMKNLGFKDSDEYLQKSVQPLLDKLGITWSRLPDQYLCIESDEIAWKDRKFGTPSGKIELYSNAAKEAGLSPLPVFIPPRNGPHYLPLRLLTCHTKESMHSQGFAFTDDLPRVYVNPKTAKKFDVQGDSPVYVKGAGPRIRAVLCVDDAICDGTAFIYQGFWHKSGAVNFLTDSVISDMGSQAAFYDSFCTIERIG
jgi:anaerobic selenocysteine-containing dehydrogenase